MTGIALLVVRGSSGGFQTSATVGYIFCAVVIVAGAVGVYLIRRHHRADKDGPTPRPRRRRPRRKRDGNLARR